MQREGRRVARGLLQLVIAASPLGQARPARLGLVASKRIGNAVQRNSFKRWVREWFRTHQDELPRGVDLVAIGKAGVVQRGREKLWTDLQLVTRGLSR